MGASTSKKTTGGRLQNTTIADLVGIILNDVFAKNVNTPLGTDSHGCSYGTLASLNACGYGYYFYAAQSYTPTNNGDWGALCSGTNAPPNSPIKYSFGPITGLENTTFEVTQLLVLGEPGGPVTGIIATILAQVEGITISGLTISSDCLPPNSCTNAQLTITGCPLYVSFRVTATLNTQSTDVQVATLNVDAVSVLNDLKESCSAPRSNSPPFPNVDLSCDSDNKVTPILQSALPSLIQTIVPAILPLVVTLPYTPSIDNKPIPSSHPLFQVPPASACAPNTIALNSAPLPCGTEQSPNTNFITDAAVQGVTFQQCQQLCQASFGGGCQGITYNTRNQLCSMFGSGGQYQPTTNGNLCGWTIADGDQVGCIPSSEYANAPPVPACLGFNPAAGGLTCPQICSFYDGLQGSGTPCVGSWETPPSNPPQAPCLLVAALDAQPLPSSNSCVWSRDISQYKL